MNPLPDGEGVDPEAPFVLRPPREPRLHIGSVATPPYWRVPVATRSAGGDVPSGGADRERIARLCCHPASATQNVTSGPGLASQASAAKISAAMKPSQTRPAFSQLSLKASMIRLESSIEPGHRVKFSMVDFVRETARSLARLSRVHVPGRSVRARCPTPSPSRATTNRRPTRKSPPRSKHPSWGRIGGVEPRL
jgi:hypothetical protein